MRFNQLRRREFITLLGGAAVAWPVAARAQQAGMPMIGFLSARSSGDSVQLLVAFRQGLKEAGYVEGQNVAIEFRFAEGKYDQLPALARDLVRRNVAVIAAISGTPAAFAAKAATSVIPIVFANGSDPIEFGLVASLSRPGGNLTGVTFLAMATIAKRLGVLRELVPTATALAYLANPSNQLAKAETRETENAAHTLGLQFHVLNASAEHDIDRAFASVVQNRVGAFVIGSDTFFSQRKSQIIMLAARHRVPTMYYEREYAIAGGLISYGTDFADSYRQAGAYAGRILNGAKPGDLPVLQPTKFELLINLKTAKALGVEIPPMLIARADEVIE
jgi:putative ABC transport system substrate-binding protein